MRIARPLFVLTCVALLRTASAQSSIEGELFPPDFLMAQREALGLSEAQVQGIQSTMQEMGPKFDEVNKRMAERANALKDMLKQTKPDLAQSEEKLRALLTEENEIKVLQVRFLLTLRNSLTPEQMEKARQAREKITSTYNANPELPKRLQTKFEQLKGIITQQASGGQPPEELVAKAQGIQQLVQQGKPQEAEQQLDALLGSLAKPKP